MEEHAAVPALSGSHRMELVKALPSGAEHWICLECGRQILLSWPPDYKRTVLVPGDDRVSHAASKGGIRMGPLAATEAGAPPAETLH